MTDTPVLSLPLLQPAQAQKHVTVNEAVIRLDALTKLTLVSVSESTPPAAVPDGVVYAVPPGGVNEWAGQDGNLAIAINNGWEFVTPARGWTAVVLDTGASAIFDGTDWRGGAMTLTPNGGSLGFRSVEIDVTLTTGPTATTPVLFPARAIAFGVTGRVIDAVTGLATSWDLGVPGDTGRYGTGIGIAVDSWVNGPGSPIVYWSPTALEITAQGGDFTGGTLRLVAHFAELGLPNAT